LQKDRQELSYEQQQGVQLREELRLLSAKSIDLGSASACAARRKNLG